MLSSGGGQFVCWPAESGHVGGEGHPLPEDGRRPRGDEARADQEADLHHQDAAVGPPRARPHPPHHGHPLHHQREEGGGGRQEDAGGRGGEEQERPRQPRVSGAVLEHPRDLGVVTGVPAPSISYLDICVISNC